MKKICFVAQFPPPIHGLSKAVETLYSSELSTDYCFEKINITDNKRLLSNLIAIKKSKADLFYFTISQTRGGNFRDLILLRAIGERPCLVHLHGGYYRTLVDRLPKWQKKANYRAIGKLAGAIVLGPSLKWIFKDMISEDRIFTVPNCVDDIYLMSDAEFNKKIASIDNRVIKHVLYLSNFIESKGYKEVLEMARLEKQRVDLGFDKRFHFDFAGNFFEKTQNDFFINFIRDNKLEGFVTYHGVVEGNQKRELLKKCDLFVLLTKYPNEGQPISILEAMGNGMVIVTTDHAGISDLVTDGENGIQIRKNNIDANDVYDRICRICQYQEIETTNRKKITDNYMQENYICKMRKIFISIINKI